MASVIELKGLFRVVETDGSLVRGPSGKPIDGGGFRLKEMAERQAKALNSSKHRRRSRERNKFRH
jgi:hypothetical protein